MDVKLSSIKKINLFYFLIIIAFLFSCSKEIKSPPDLNDPSVVENIADSVLSIDVKFSSSGHFDSDKKLSIVAGTEAHGINSIGISFKLIENKEGEFKVVYRTGFLDGSFNKCMVDKIKLSSIGGEMIYYNSKNYFMGTGGGDVYSYIVDFRKREVYSAHLFAGEGTRSVLYLSENVEDRMLRQFFISYFRKDYPSLKVIQSDN